ncbi:MAG: hypothetical protein N2747_00390 [Chitinophagaceae bacterium]|nr:hypothetical protein [Chitinophagaceae bacterium]
MSRKNQPASKTENAVVQPSVNPEETKEQKNHETATNPQPNETNLDDEQKKEADAAEPQLQPNKTVPEEVALSESHTQPSAHVRKLYQTADGIKFYLRNDAENHARLLREKYVVEITEETSE